jgi:hypothetical protein
MSDDILDKLLPADPDLAGLPEEERAADQVAVRIYSRSLSSKEKRKERSMADAMEANSEAKPDGADVGETEPNSPKIVNVSASGNVKAPGSPKGRMQLDVQEKPKEEPKDEKTAVKGKGDKKGDKAHKDKKKGGSPFATIMVNRLNY